MFKDKNLLVIAVIAVVNALGYGIIIPILYSYSQKFGLNDFQNGMLFAIFSVCQFISTPVIGRLSDKFGRKPLLIISLIGTAVSFLMMGFARSALWLFLARALDGITAGNIPVAQAVISDTTKPEDRARGFGLIGASFGFGFIFGPAISALTVGFGASIPFLIAAAVTIVAIIMTFVMLPETNKHIGEVVKVALFDFGKLAKALVDPKIGMTLLISLIYSLAFGLFIFAYQPVSVKVLHLSATQISINFTIFGLVGLVAQMLIIPFVNKKLGDAKTLAYSLVVSIFTFIAFYFSRNLWVFTIVSIVHSLINAFVNPVLSSLLSKEVDAKSQGEMQGINASYMSLGLIFGPIIGGLVASFAIPAPFLVGGLMALICATLAVRVLRIHEAKVSLE